MKLLCLGVLGLLIATIASAQTPASKLEFEVASVKPFSINTNGVDSVTLGAKIDGAQVRMVGLTMRDLLASAYRVKLYLVVGPEWMATERYDINAKLPDGVSPDKMPEMLQALLTERFHLQVHKEKEGDPGVCAAARQASTAPQGDRDRPQRAGAEGRHHHRHGWSGGGFCQHGQRLFLQPHWWKIRGEED